jgi:hypothetical protein
LRRSSIFLLGFLVVFTAHNALAQSADAAQSNDSHKYRTILTIAGAAGGFATGFYIGRAAYDTPDSDRKVWTASAISAAIGGAGGYLIGRAIDTRRNRKRISLGSEKFNVIPLVSKDTKGLQFSVGF